MHVFPESKQTNQRAKVSSMVTAAELGHFAQAENTA